MNRIGGDASHWRQVLAELDSVAATLPLSTHAAQILASRGKRTAAAAAYRELLQRDPRNLRWLRSLEALLLQMGKPEEAAECRRKAIGIELDNMQLPVQEQEDALAFLLAAEGLTEQPARAPADYVAAHFDDYAERFDSHLVEKLHYRGPQVVFDAVADAQRTTPDADPRRLCWENASLRVLDVGCGTGLAGPLMRPIARRLDGVDLSPRMVEKARATELYDQLVVGDLLDVLSQTSEQYDLLVAVDVLEYLGDLEPMFAASRRVLCPGGLLGFSVESSVRPGFHLASTRRYIHHRDYLSQAAQAAGLRMILIREAVLRYERRQPVQSWVCVLANGTEDGTTVEGDHGSNRSMTPTA